MLTFAFLVAAIGPSLLEIEGCLVLVGFVHGDMELATAKVVNYFELSKKRVIFGRFLFREDYARSKMSAECTIVS